MTAEIRQGDCLSLLREMPDGTVQTVVTSPPYFGLRCYGHDEQIGLEETPDAYVSKLVEVFREVRRVMRDDATLWLNLGDSYAGSGVAGPLGKPALGGRGDFVREHGINEKHADLFFGRAPTPSGLKPKDLIGVPWRVAFALQADGWYLRSDIIWAKPNPMPESVRDRPTRSHEYIFMLSKSSRYYWDQEAVREPHTDSNGSRLEAQREYGTTSEDVGESAPYAVQARHRGLPGVGTTSPGWNPAGRNIRSVWNIATQPYKEAHFATFPEKLVEPCILAGSSPKACGECGAPWERVVEKRSFDRTNDRLYGGTLGNNPSGKVPNSNTRGCPDPEVETVGWQSTCKHKSWGDDRGQSLVLDPFCGSGTVGVVALRHGRSFIGLELNPSYCQMAAHRISDDAPLLNVVEYAA